MLLLLENMCVCVDANPCALVHFTRLLWGCARACLDLS